jgi:DNA-binding MarR family transcriptional regulator
MSRSAATSAYNLTESPSHLLHRAQQFAADRFTAEMDGEAITQRQFAVLSAVASNEGLTQTDLVRATGIDRSTLAELVARMARRKLLARTRAEADARANVVSLTAEGRKILNTALPRVAKADGAILDALPKNKRGAFLDTLQRIAKSLDEAEPAKPDGGASAAAAPAKPARKTKAAAPAKKPAKKAKAAAPKKAKASKPAKKSKKAKKAKSKKS